MASLRGSFYVLMLYDVGEQIRMEALLGLLGSQPPRRQPTFKHPTPQYVRFERPPMVEQTEGALEAMGERFQARIKYYDYGIVSLELELPFESDWDQLVKLSSRWIASAELDRVALELARKHVRRIDGALIEPYETWLSEDYYVIHIAQALSDENRPMTAAEVLEKHGGEIAQMIRGDSATLSAAERHDALQSSLSYYPTDLFAAGWVAALIYDTPEGAAPAIQLIEYANTQLLEYRHYDEALSEVLADVYRTLEHKGGWFRRWRLARKAERLNAMRLEVTELAERTDNAIKFLSDMFYARAHKTAAAKIGVTDYRNLVEAKLRTAGELYAFMTNEFHQARAFVLEAMVVAILIVDLVMLFRG